MALDLTPITDLALNAIRQDLEVFLRTATRAGDCARYACVLEEIARDVMAMRKAVLVKQGYLLDELDRVPA